MRSRNPEKVLCEALDVAVAVGRVVGTTRGGDVVKLLSFAQIARHSVLIIFGDNARDVDVLDIGFQRRGKG